MALCRMGLLDYMDSKLSRQLFVEAEQAFTPAVKKLAAEKFGDGWLEQCRESVGRAMQDHVGLEGKWDIYTLTRVLFAK